MRRSFTLVEMLLALTLTTMLVAITGKMAVQTLVTRKTVESDVDKLERVALVLDRIEHDVASLIDDMPETHPPMMVFGFPRQVLQLTLLGEVGLDDPTLHVVRRPATVRYRLVEDPSKPGGYRLIRESLDLTSPTATWRRETYAVDVAQWQVRVLVGETWLDRYSPQRGVKVEALAVRVSIRWVDSDAMATRTFLLSDRLPKR